MQRAPGIPCALCFEGEDKEFASLGRNRAARTIFVVPDKRLVRRSSKSEGGSAIRDPYAAADIVGNEWQTALLEQLRPVVMGPGLRRGDESMPLLRHATTHGRSLSMHAKRRAFVIARCAKT